MTDTEIRKKYRKTSGIGVESSDHLELNAEGMTWNHFYWCHCIAGTSKHGYRHQNHISISLRSEDMVQNMLF